MRLSGGFVNQFEFEPVGIGKKHGVVARRVLILGGRIQYLDTAGGEEAKEAINLRFAPRTKSKMVKTRRVAVVAGGRTRAMQRYSEHRVVPNFPARSVARVNRDTLEPEFRQHLMVEIDRCLEVRDGQIDVMRSSGHGTMFCNTRSFAWHTLWIVWQLGPVG